jgi:hypothetical protein
MGILVFGQRGRVHVGAAQIRQTVSPAARLYAPVCRAARPSAAAGSTASFSSFHSHAGRRGWHRRAAAARRAPGAADLPGNGTNAAAPSESAATPPTATSTGCTCGARQTAWAPARAPAPPRGCAGSNQAATPAIRPPPPTLTSTLSGRPPCCSISRASVPAPCHHLGLVVGMGQQARWPAGVLQAGLQRVGIAAPVTTTLAPSSRSGPVWPRRDFGHKHLAAHAQRPAAAAVAIPALPPEATITPLAGMGWTAGGSACPGP